MTDDPTIVRPRFGAKPREEATCTHAVPSECPDRYGSDNLRGPVRLGDEIPANLVESESLHRAGLGRGIPHTTGSTRIGYRTLEELRERAESAARAAAEAEKSLLAIATQVERAANMVTLSRIENETLARRLGELLGDDDPEPRGAA